MRQYDRGAGWSDHNVGVRIHVCFRDINDNPHRHHIIELLTYFIQWPNNDGTCFVDSLLLGSVCLMYMYTYAL